MKKIYLLLLILTIPAFLMMLRSGFFTVSDFHLFRLYEFGLCMRDGQIPCRWSPDAGFGFGEPVFNFYTQLPYLFGFILNSLGLTLIGSMKTLFILSFVFSFFSMYFASFEIWKSRWGAILSAMLYLYAPYRAVDVWVRGALPESLSFIFFPLIILYFEKMIKRKGKYFFILIFLFSILLLTHNISFFIFNIFFIPWVFYRYIISKKTRLLLLPILSIVIAGLISSFYLLPVIFESKFVMIDSTTMGYFDFRGHFVGLTQLLLSTNWGYGASVFGPEDGLNLSIGFMQWLGAAAAFFLIVIRKEIVKYKDFITLLLFGLFFLFLIHPRSIDIWELAPFFSYIQFPWRFLGISLFCLSLAVGVLGKLIKSRYILFLVGLFSIVFTFSYFREDIWLDVGDNYYLEGEFWDIERSASALDFWPKYGDFVPNYLAPTAFSGTELIVRNSNSAIYKIVDEDFDSYIFPMAYFSGWRAFTNEREIELSYNNEGLMLVKGGDVELGEIRFEFKNTGIRTFGNLISLLTLSALLLFSFLRKFKIIR